MEGLSNNGEGAKNIVRWDKSSLNETLKAFNSLGEGDVLVSGSGTRRKFLNKYDHVYTFERTGKDGKVTIESLPEADVYDGFAKVYIEMEKAGEEIEKSRDEAVTALRELKPGDVLNSKSGTFRTFLGRDGDVYKFERSGADGEKSTESMSEKNLVANFGNIKNIKKSIG